MEFRQIEIGGQRLRPDPDEREHQPRHESDPDGGPQSDVNEEMLERAISRQGGVNMGFHKKPRGMNDDFGFAMQAADNMDSFIEAAKSGNKVAHGFLPTEGALEASTAQGVKRVNMAEIKSYGGAGSLMDRIEGQLKGLATGQSIPPQILDDMKKVSDAIRRNATTKHESAVKAVNVSYGSSFEPLSKKSGAIPLDDYLKLQRH